MVDLNKIRELAARADELEAEGKSPAEIQSFIDYEISPEQRRLSVATQQLHGDAAPPGETPDKPLGVSMMEAAFRAQGGQRVRPAAGMGKAATEAAFNVLFERAAKGDPQARFKAPDESWNEAKARWEQSQW